MSSKYPPLKVAIILHPLNIELFLYNFHFFYRPISYLVKPFERFFSPYLIKKFYPLCSPHVFMNLKEIDLGEDRRINLIGVMCPLFPDQLILNPKQAIDKIIYSAQLAKRMGAQIVALAGFTSIVSNGGIDILGQVNLAITSGNSLTAALGIEGIERAVKLCNKKMENCTMAIIGATGDIGSICAKIFARKLKKIILCARKKETINDLAAKLKETHKIEIEIECSAKVASQKSDIILTATSSLGNLIELSELKTGAIVCDLAMPPNILRSSIQERKDVFVFDGGRAKIKFYDKIKNKQWTSLFPQNVIYGCFAEAIALALENKFESYSVGKGNITEEKVNNIRMIGKKNGIELSEFYFGNKKYSEHEFEDLRQINHD